VWVGQWQTSICAHGRGRGVDDGHGREVLGLVVGVVVVVLVVDGHCRRGLGGPALGHVNDEGVGDQLSPGEVGVERAAHVLLGPQSALVSPCCISRKDAQRHVGGVEAPAQRVGVLLQNHVPHIVDQVVFPDLHQGGRGIGPLDPDLAVQHAGAEVRGWSAKVVGGCWRARLDGCGGSVGDQQGFDYLRIGVGDDRLAADGGWRGEARRWVRS